MATAPWARPTERAPWERPDAVPAPQPGAGDEPPQLTTSKPDLQHVSLLPGAASDVGHDVGDLFAGVGSGLANTAHGLGSMLGKVIPASTSYGKDFGAGLDELNDLSQTHGPLQAVGKGLEQAGEFLVPGGAEEKLTSMAPKAIRPLAKIGTAALSSGAVNAVQGGSFRNGAEIGAAGSGAAEGLRAIAPAIAESALRVRGNQRLFGRTVGDAILNDTGPMSIRPETIGRQAGQTISRLSPELDAADAASAARGGRGSLRPARDAVNGRINTFLGNRAVNTASELSPIRDFLTTDQTTGRPLATLQAAPGIRALKRGLNEDYIGKWSLEQPAAQKGAARAAYGRLNDELHSLSPETQDIDQRISSLIPVRLQGERVASQAPMAQRVMGRVGAHTGALTSAALGAGAGYHEGGAEGAFAGGLAGLLVPEAIASPEGQMAIARTLHAAPALRPLALGAGFQIPRANLGRTTGTGDLSQ